MTRAYAEVIVCFALTSPGDYTSGTRTIAIMSPPLPFSNGQVFVQSIPEKFNVGFGRLNDESAESILRRATSNAIVVFELYSKHPNCTGLSSS